MIDDKNLYDHDYILVMMVVDDLAQRENNLDLVVISVKNCL